MTTDNTPDLPAIPGSMPFIHNVDTAPAYWWLDILWVILVDGKDTGGHKGDFVFVPRNTRHAFRVDSETAGFLNGYTPAGLEAAVTDLAMPAPERVIPPKGATPMTNLSPEQYRRYGMDNVPGPNRLAPDGH